MNPGWVLVGLKGACVTALGVGLGTFPFSNVFGRVSEEEASKIVHTFLAQGGRYIQTAPYYEGVDPLMGRILRGVPRDSYTFGTLCVKGRDSKVTGKYDAVIAQCEDSLRQLGLDHIDVYLTSTNAADAPFAETVQAMTDLQTQGKVREIGVCNVNRQELEEYVRGGAIRYVQNRFSLVDQEADLDVRQYCSDNQIGLVPYNVVEWGLLTSKSLTHWTLREGDLRTAVLPVFGADQMRVLGDWVRDEVLPIAERAGSTIEALAIHWVLSQPAVSFCPVGATQVAQIESSLKANDLAGRTDLVDALDRAYESLTTSVQERYGSPLNDFLRNSYGKW